ncbi:hypothetical protein EPA93_24755 [Ktedonosporobacter rubrisoli]|uniref:DUF3159 domain-containing protein n=1 Tax=Ktedonosporobacter rubrisoli TaxID=2509675 RepID=A0A4P6JTU5_KTERU|nr:VC0807 family protein [Ktedonosporobacter rubrisoli]QBD79019.1 hypothetical protein EPA93_24755 [Ktedonosporobacter rubrisoli]
MANSSPLNADASKKARMISSTLGIGYSILINGALPFIIYSLLTSYTRMPEIWALLLSGVPPIIDSIVGVIRKRRIDLIAGIVLAGIAISLFLMLLGGSPRLYLVRESFFTGAFGLAYLVSLLFPRPLGFFFARHFATGNVPEKVAWFNSLWQYRGFRISMRVSTIVWGLAFVLEAIIRTALAFILSVQEFLLISPFVFYGTMGLVIVWTMLYSRKGNKRAQALMAQREETSATPVVEEKGA